MNKDVSIYVHAADELDLSFRIPQALEAAGVRSNQFYTEGEDVIWVDPDDHQLALETIVGMGFACE